MRRNQTQSIIENIKISSVAKLPHKFTDAQLKLKGVMRRQRFVGRKEGKIRARWEE